MTDDYKCHDPDCTETLAWHLINGDLDCIGDNREAVAEFARQAEAEASSHVKLFVVAEGYLDTTVEFDLIPISAIPHSTPDEEEPTHRVHEPMAHDMGHM
jgi:hypothetical protein